VKGRGDDGLKSGAAKRDGLVRQGTPKDGARRKSELANSLQLKKREIVGGENVRAGMERN